MKNIASLFCSLLVFFTAVSAFACSPFGDSTSELGLLAIVLSVIPAVLYSLPISIYMFAMRKRHALSFKPSAIIALKATGLAYLASASSIFAVTVVEKSLAVPSNLMITFVATAPLVVLAGYFTRVYYDCQAKA